VELKGKTVVVTGGARRVGRAIVEALASAGAIPIVHYHQSQVLALELAKAAGGIAIQADLSTPAGAVKLTDEVRMVGGELVLWVNNAASFVRAPFAEADEALWQRTLQLVLLSPARCARFAAETMVPGGLIVNVLDVAAFQPWRDFAHHCVAKAALEMLTRCLAIELAPRIRVCGIAPGPVLLPDEIDPAVRERLLRRVPLGREGHPAHVAHAVCFAAANDYLTGSVIKVDGGILATTFAP
jgi:NAD(P)-dependent dehydrogenase (short-subunit alcohol dehydrogenase family)